jgi:serine/threonine protein kinase
MDNDKYIGMMLDNRYEILERIGIGGMAVVYKARCHRLNRFVAIKILKSELAEDEEFRRRFHAESQAVAMLSHPNIVAVYDVNTWQDIDYIVMELIEGITLKQYIKRKGVLNWKETLHFSTQIAKALQHAHSRGIIHRDIKPHNIMILKDGSVKVADFGIARLLSTQNTMTHEALGSVHYISPEQAKGSPVDARSDLYSVGVVMYEMLTGRLPFEGESAVSIAIQHISSIPLLPREINPDIPVGLEEITMHAMEPDLNQRYASADELLADLEEFRKNPTATFGYMTPLKQGVDDLQDDATRTIPTDDIRNAIQPGDRPRRSGVRRISEDYVHSRKRANRTSLLVGVFCVMMFLIVMFVFLWNYYLREIFAPTDDRVAIPDFRNQSAEEIINDDQYKADFVFKTETAYNADVAAGNVISQEPAAEREIMRDPDGIEIVLTVSLGEEVIKMPSILNIDYREAKVMLEEYGLDLQFDMEAVDSDDYTVGYVMEQEPAEDTPLSEGQTVRIVYSKGPSYRTTTVPQVVSYTESRAITLLENSNLAYHVTREPSDTYTAGVVIYQSIPADTEVTEHTMVELIVSTGPENADNSAENDDQAWTSITEMPKVLENG